jgi:hypothetical protein
MTHYKESATIKNLKPEWWGSPLVEEEKYQEKYQEKPVKREEGEIIIIIIINILDWTRASSGKGGAWEFGKVNTICSLSLII